MTLRRIFLQFIGGLVISSLAAAVAAAAEPLPGKARLNLVFILDGLRPDSINPEDTPSLFKLRQEGVNYLNGHSVFPTVTRVNATAMATGTYPGKNGIVGNTLYVPKVNPNRAFNNDDYKNLLKLDEVTQGNMVLVKSLGELLHARGMKLAGVSSGSSGQSLLLNPRAPNGVGFLSMVTSSRIRSRKPFQSSPALPCCGIHRIRAVRSIGKKANCRHANWVCSFIPWR